VNNQRSSTQQFFLFLALSWCAMLVFQQYFGPKKTAGNARPMPANALQAAFAGLDPAKPPILDKASAPAEILKLEGQIKANESDDLSYWARLRAGLIQQYVLQDAKSALAHYDQIEAHHGTTDISAQAAYQKGDLLWRQSTANGGKPSQEAAKALESLIHRGRGSSAFLDLKIFVPSPLAASMTTPPTALPAAWELKTVRELHGTATNPLPGGILERVDTYYATTTFHKIFDGAARLFGNNPAYSYGLAILAFAFCTRLFLQPLNKKQYDSMRGMAIIAPEMKRIQDKYKNKKDQESQMRMMTEIRTLQKSHGVNPMMGCGLAAVQIPVFFYVVSPFIQHFEARMELVGASFLWIHNLARPDVPLLVMYALSQFASMRLSSTPPADEQQRQMQLMMLFFPFAVPFFLLSWPSAFTMYWMTFNILSMFFQYNMMKKADPSKRLWHQLVMQPLIPKIVTADANGVPAGAIPPRPKNDSRRVSVRESGLREDAVKTLAPDSSNGAAKSKAVEATESADDSSAFTSSAALNGSLNGSATATRKKRKKR
jgi:YidC/Oxa1 family membrane protein insertase